MGPVVYYNKREKNTMSYCEPTMPTESLDTKLRIA